MKKISEYLFLWAVGGCLYYTFEVAFRGFSHWTMFVLGGIVLVFCTAQGKAGNWKDPLAAQLVRCIVFVTSCEFITGIIVNKWLGLAVWDYRGVPFELFGQICLPFMALFSFLCLIGIYLGGYLLYFLYGEEKPCIPVW